MKKFSLSIIGIVLVLLLSACSSRNESDYIFCKSFQDVKYDQTNNDLINKDNNVGKKYYESLSDKKQETTGGEASKCYLNDNYKVLVVLYKYQDKEYVHDINFSFKKDTTEKDILKVVNNALIMDNYKKISSDEYTKLVKDKNYISEINNLNFAYEENKKNVTISYAIYHTVQ
ncbi:MAG: hypothetical protein LBT75_00690 [Bacilli bacterium]|jgi:hypothetical protein|nr:hypothetical protein [Bacilli bacterium]